MISKKMEKALNEQINAELFSAYLYLSMSAHFQALNLPGFANWMRVQVQEELVHAMKFYDFVLQRGGRVNLGLIEGPAVSWASGLEAFSQAYEHETKITARINRLVDLSAAEKDHATNNFLQWFISEQVEEEANTNDVVQKLKLMGEAGNGLFMLDRELATRVFVPPVAAAGAGAP